MPNRHIESRAGRDGDGGPALYCSTARCVDEALNPQGLAFAEDDVRFRHFLFQNIACGMTVVLNRAARDLIVAAPPDPGEIIMHDWWAALVVSAFGKVVHDPESRVLYRQHGLNVVGARVTPLSATHERLARLRRDPRRFYRVHAQAAALLRLFGERLPPHSRRMTERFVASRRSLVTRLAYALSGPVTRVGLVEEVLCRGLIAAGLY